MPTWTKDDLATYQARRAASGAEPERIVPHESVAKEEGKAGNSIRYAVCIRSFRSRLCDPDNLCPKYFIDCLRYAGSIPDDRPQDITLSISQFKVPRHEQRTEIEIIPLS